MLFFFVGGVDQNMKKVVQQGYGPCVSCRTGTTDLIEMAQRLSVFCVPVLNFKKQTTLVCRRCDFACSISKYEALQKDESVHSSPSSTSMSGHSEDQNFSCRHCGAPISDQWKFCRTCGVTTGSDDE